MLCVNRAEGVLDERRAAADDISTAADLGMVQHTLAEKIIDLPLEHRAAQHLGRQRHEVIIRAVVAKMLLPMRFKRLEDVRVLLDRHDEERVRFLKLVLGMSDVVTAEMADALGMHVKERGNGVRMLAPLVPAMKRLALAPAAPDKDLFPHDLRLRLVERVKEILVQAILLAARHPEGFEVGDLDAFRHAWKIADDDGVGRPLSLGQLGLRPAIQPCSCRKGSCILALRRIDTGDTEVVEHVEKIFCDAVRAIEHILHFVPPNLSRPAAARNTSSSAQMRPAAPFWPPSAVRMRG